MPSSKGRDRQGRYRHVGLRRAMILPAMLLKGLALGVAVAAPVGPVGLLCMQRTLRQGRLAGLASGLGVATADALYAAAAGVAMAALAAFMTRHRVPLQLIGGLVSIALGLHSLRSGPLRRPAAARSGGLLIDYVSTLLLTLANPQTTLSFIAAFAALGLATPGIMPHQTGMLVLGVFLGSAAWWLMLSCGGGWLRTRLNTNRTAAFGRIAGLLLVAIGSAALVDLLVL